MCARQADQPRQSEGKKLGLHGRWGFSVRDAEALQKSLFRMHESGPLPIVVMTCRCPQLRDR